MDSADISALAADVFGRLHAKLSAVNASHTPSDPRSIVLTDWTVEYPQAWTTFSFVAAYLGWRLQARPARLTLNSANITPLGDQIFRAFDYAGHIDLAAAVHAAHKDGRIAAQISAALASWPQEGPALRERLLGLEFNGLPVGDLVYDAHLRGSGRPTIETLDECLRNDVIMAALFYKAANDILDAWSVKAVVTAHRIYYQLGMISRLALARGAVLIESGAVNPFRIKRYRNFAESMDDPLRMAPGELDRVLSDDRPAALAYGRRYMAERQEGAAQLHGAEGTDGAYGSSRRRYDKASLCARLGWSPERPIVAVMSHVFIEGPHFGRNLYDDFFQWLAETLRIAATNNQTQWLIKGHPDAVYFEDLVRSQPTAEPFERTLARLLAPYADCPHIALAPDDLNTGSLPPMVKAIVTLYGSAGIEFPAQGVPAVTAAEACYHGHGFTVECHSRAAYEQALRTIQDLPPPTPAQQERALAFFYLMQVKSRAPCDALPPLPPLDWWSPRQDHAMLTGMAERLNTYTPLSDPLYLRLGEMMDNNYTSTFSFHTNGII